MSQMILIADDSLTMRTVSEMAFHGSPYRVVSVGFGEQALQSAYELRPIVIVLDYHLPDRSGVEICRAVKSDPNLRDIPVLLVGGKFHAFDEGEARAAGADDFILKPWRTDAFIEKVTQLARTGPTARPIAAAPPARPAPAAAPPARPSRFGGPAPAPGPSSSGSMPGINPSGGADARPRFGGPPPASAQPSPGPNPAAAAASAARPRFGGPPPGGGVPSPRGAATPPGPVSGGSPTPMRRPEPPPARGVDSSPGGRLPSPPQRPTPPQNRTPLGGPSQPFGALEDPSSHDDKTPTPDVLPGAPMPVPDAPTPTPPSFSTNSAAAAMVAAPSQEQIEAAIRAAIDPDKIALLVREEVQKAVREQMLAMVKTVLGDLFQERMIPRLLKYGEDRINQVVTQDLPVAMQQAINAELAKLTDH